MTGEVKLTNVIPGQSDMEKLSGDNVCLHPWRTQDTVLLCDIIPRPDLTRCSSQILKNKCPVSHPTIFKCFFNSWDFPWEALASTPQKRKSFLCPGELPWAQHFKPVSTLSDGHHKDQVGFWVNKMILTLGGQDLLLPCTASHSRRKIRFQGIQSNKIFWISRQITHDTQIVNPANSLSKYGKLSTFPWYHWVRAEAFSKHKRYKTIYNSLVSKQTPNIQVHLYARDPTHTKMTEKTKIKRQ